MNGGVHSSNWIGYGTTNNAGEVFTMICDRRSIESSDGRLGCPVRNAAFGLDLFASEITTATAYFDCATRPLLAQSGSSLVLWEDKL